MTSTTAGELPTRYADVVPYRPSLAAKHSLARAQRDWTVAEPMTVRRRTFVKGALVGALALGIFTLDLFRFTRVAGADGYDIAGNCNGLQYDDCAGCAPETYQADHVCVYLPNASDNWHRCCNGYALRPNQCTPGGSTKYDGWYWQVPGCGCPGSKKWKCHDGKWLPYGGNWVNSACNRPVRCV